MMGSVAVLACETLRDELECAIRLLDNKYDVFWVESGLHNTPEKLRLRLQECLDGLEGYDTVLMAFGTCGNAVVGLATGAHTLVLPCVDDCISLLVGSAHLKASYSEDGGTYFVTPGWLRGERTLSVEHQHMMKKYGEEMAEKIMRTMLAHYRYLGLLESEAYDAKAVLPEVIRIAERLKLQERLIPASVSYLCDLLAGVWQDDQTRFTVYPPHTVIAKAPILV